MVRTYHFAIDLGVWLNHQNTWSGIIAQTVPKTWRLYKMAYFTFRTNLCVNKIRFFSAGIKNDSNEGIYFIRVCVDPTAHFFMHIFRLFILHLHSFCFSIGFYCKVFNNWSRHNTNKCTSFIDEIFFADAKQLLIQANQLIVDRRWHTYYRPIALFVFRSIHKEDLSHFYNFHSFSYAKSIFYLMEQQENNDFTQWTCNKKQMIANVFVYLCK